MAQPDGRLLDTHGVEPDVVVEPAPEFFIGGKDNQLEAAVQLLTNPTPIPPARG